MEEKLSSLSLVEQAKEQLHLYYHSDDLLERIMAGRNFVYLHCRGTPDEKEELDRFWRKKLTARGRHLYLERQGRDMSNTTVIY